MSATKTKVLELPNRIRKMDEKTPIQIDQNFEEIVYAISSVQKYLNETGYSAIEGNTEFEANAITCGAEEPTD